MYRAFGAIERAVYMVDNGGQESKGRTCDYVPAWQRVCTYVTGYLRSISNATEVLPLRSFALLCLLLWCSPSSPSSPVSRRPATGQKSFRSSLLLRPFRIMYPQADPFSIGLTDHAGKPSCECIANVSFLRYGMNTEIELSIFSNKFRDFKTTE